MSCDTSQFPVLKCFVTHVKQHEVKGLSKDYHLLLQLKLGYGKFAMIRTPGDFVACTTMLNKTWSLDVPHYEKTSTRWLWTVYTGLFWSPTTNKTPLN